MELLDGLNYYMDDSEFWNFTSRLETAAKEVMKFIEEFGRSPSKEALSKAHTLLVKIELWKAGCIEELTGNYAVQNLESDVWNAFCDAVDAMNARKDGDALLSIMRLKGFGKYPNEDFGNQRPEKRATAVLRMFWPEKWGVVDWRTAGMLWALKEKNWDVDQAIALAKLETKGMLKKEFAMINEDLACVFNQMYRDWRSVAPLSRTADVEMAVFGLSFIVWPLQLTSKAARKRIA